MLSPLRLCFLPLAFALAACERTPPPAEPGEALSGGATTVRLHEAGTRQAAHVPSSIGAPWRRPATVPVALRERSAPRSRQLQTTGKR